MKQAVISKLANSKEMVVSVYIKGTLAYNYRDGDIEGTLAWAKSKGAQIEQEDGYIFSDRFSMGI